jgi:hypothetical protein
MKGKVSRNHLRNWMEKWKGVSRLSVRCLLLVATVIVTFTILSVTEVEAKSKKKCRLSYTSKTMEQGELYNISLKGVPKSVKAKKIRWKSSNKKVVSIRSKKKNKAVLMAKKEGTAKITATYKGKKYNCNVRVVSDTEADNKEKTDNPVLNATSVELHYIPDYAVAYLGKNSSYQYSFQFKVSGTDEDVKSWSIEGDKEAQIRYRIDDGGNIYMFCGNNYSDDYTECTVKATLSDGRVLTASVKGYDDVGIYVRKVIDKFKKTYIKDSMTEYEKMEKVAWYLIAEYDYELYQDDWIRYIVTRSGDCMASRFAVMYFCREVGLKAEACRSLDAHGETVVRVGDKVYMVVTGFDGPKPREYMIYEISRETFDKISKENGLHANYFWE